VAQMGSKSMHSHNGNLRERDGRDGAVAARDQSARPTKMWVFFTRI
jgi:hypothetical protein